MKATPASPILLLVFLFLGQSVQAEEPLHKLPVVTGKVIFAEGSFFGYSPPRAGDTIRLDLGALDSITNGISFHRSKSADSVAPYLPLPAPLRIERSERDQDGKLLVARLISGSKDSDGTERVIIDIQRYGTKGAVWIIEEHKIVMSVARLECEFSE